MSIQNNQTTDKRSGGLGIIARLSWMFFGNAVLLISILFIFGHKGGVFHTADVVFWITVAALILVRYLDIKLFGGLTATGLPALITNWIKYVASLRRPTPDNPRKVLPISDPANPVVSSVGMFDGQSCRRESFAASCSTNRWFASGR